MLSSRLNRGLDRGLDSWPSGSVCRVVAASMFNAIDRGVKELLIEPICERFGVDVRCKIQRGSWVVVA